MGDLFKWGAVLLAVFIAWRWLGSAFNSSQTYGGPVPPMYGGNPGGVWFDPGMVQSPWLGVQVHSVPQRWSGRSGVYIGNGGAEFGIGGADINFSF